MADDVRAMTAELARDPTSLVFLRLGEVLRLRGQIEAAAKVALAGLEHHPEVADAHDLYARILADAGDLEGAAQEWQVALSLEPRHAGAHKGLGFVRFQQGDLDAALDHLELALAADPKDTAVVQALARVRAAAQQAAEAAAAEAAGPSRDSGVFAGLEGAQDRLLLVDARGRVLGGGLRTAGGKDVAEEVAAYLAGVSQEADRTARLLELGQWRWIMAEGTEGHLHLSVPASGTLLLMVRDRSVPSGRLAILAERAAHAARRWLEAEA
jgi:tetratricopeptide (TPR) repeat protein